MSGNTQGTGQTRVAVTGIAVTTGLGDDTDTVWKAVRSGAAAIRPIERLDVAALRCQIAAELLSAPSGEDRAMGLARRVAHEAVESAGIDLDAGDPYRQGIALGTSVGGLERGEAWHAQLIDGGPEATDPDLLLTYPLYTSADAVGADLGLRGPKVVISNACAAGGNAIGWAADEIRLGRADVMLAGGVDVLDLLSLGGFDGLRALDPEPCAPLSRSSGVNLGEGCAMVVLESEESASARAAEPIAWLSGYGLSSDAHHATAPDPRGDGARRAMSAAIRQAGLDVADIDYLNAHGTGTPANDKSEPAAVDALFGDSRPPMSSTKSQVGHTLGAAGAVEAVVTVLALRDGELPPTANVDADSPVRALRDIVPDVSRAAQIGQALSNSFAFGGNNCSLLFSADPGPRPEATGGRRVVVTGAEAFTSLGTGRGELTEQLSAGALGWAEATKESDADDGPGPLARLDPASYLAWVDPGYRRRVDQIGALVMAVTRSALEDADLSITRDEAERSGMVFGTFTGPLETVTKLSEVIIKRGVQHVSPRLFPNSVVNAAVGHACLSLQLKGPLSTLASGGTAGLGALQYAADLITAGEAEVMLAVAADEMTPELRLGYQQLGLLGSPTSRPYSRTTNGLIPGAGAAVLVLEDRDHALARGARILAEVAGSGSTADTAGVGRIDTTGAGWTKSMTLAIERAGLRSEEILAVFGDARGTPAIDRAEARAISHAIGAQARVANVGAQVGHLGATTPLVSAVVALTSLGSGWVPSLPGLLDPIEDAAGFRTGGGEHPGTGGVLLTSANWGGSYTSVVLTVPEQQ